MTAIVESLCRELEELGYRCESIYGSDIRVTCPGDGIGDGGRFLVVVKATRLIVMPFGFWFDKSETPNDLILDLTAPTSIQQLFDHLEHWSRKVVI